MNKYVSRILEEYRVKDASQPEFNQALEEVLSSTAVIFDRHPEYEDMYNTIDSVVVGNYVGSTALAAVGASTPVINLLIAFFMGLAVGAGVVVSRYFGARRIPEMSAAIHTFLAFSLWFGIGMLSSLFLRIRDQKLHQEPGIVPLFEPLTEHRSLSLKEYFPLDENTCGYGFACLKNGSDPVAADLAGRLLDRRLFEYQDRDPQSERQIKRKLKENGWDPRYYFCTDDVHQNPYTPYKGLGEEAIWILTDTGKIRELSNASVIVKSLTHGESRSDNKVFYPKMQ